MASVSSHSCIKEEMISPSSPSSQNEPQTSPKYEVPSRTPTPPMPPMKTGDYSSPIKQERSEKETEQVEAKQPPQVWIAGQEPWKRQRIPVWLPGMEPYNKRQRSRPSWTQRVWPRTYQMRTWGVTSWRRSWRPIPGSIHRRSSGDRGHIHRANRI